MVYVGGVSRARGVHGGHEGPDVLHLHAGAPYNGATLDDLHEAVTLLEENERITRRVFGGAHPLAMQMEHDLKMARAKLRAHEIAEAMLATTLGDA